MNSSLKKIGAALATATLALLVAGCGSSPSAGDAAATGGEDKDITFAIVPGWNDALDVSSVFKYVLERNGYTFETTELTEIATIFTAAAEGNVDAFSAAPTSVHKVYWDEYQANLDDLGAYYENGAIYIAVPDYMTDVNSLEDLAAHADDFDGTIYGIEPGSGLVKTTQEAVFPAYGLDQGFELKASSTAAMLAELDKATNAKEPVAVTVWTPWWVNTTFPIKKLEDPKEAYGPDYTFNIVASKAFSEESPAAAEMMSNFTLTDEQFNSLDDAIYNQFEPGQEQDAVASWFEQYPELLEELESYVKG
ncbi:MULTISPECIES: glycine betaine ABC transporter substrate-binding protein [Microbacterium]|uniref:glycine betaine ABC transporter substrate-binding protein n=1 Tax=Microbacterium TaxID=33882 RepID=UPI000D6410F9|nr:MULTISPECIES: glycine betaine ABC transporter substrate-binding protein [Microbacterium]